MDAVVKCWQMPNQSSEIQLFGVQMIASMFGVGRL